MSPKPAQQCQRNTAKGVRCTKTTTAPDGWCRCCAGVVAVPRVDRPLPAVAAPLGTQKVRVSPHARKRHSQRFGSRRFGNDPLDAEGIIRSLLASLAGQVAPLISHTTSDGRPAPSRRYACGEVTLVLDAANTSVVTVIRTPLPRRSSANPPVSLSARVEGPIFDPAGVWARLRPKTPGKFAPRP